MKWFRSHFEYTKQQRSGIFFLLLVIVVLLVSYALLRWNSESTGNSSFTVDKQLQRQFDSLKLASKKEEKRQLKPFNPNFISDFKGYVLGMSPEEIDRLHSFRKEDRYVRSVQEFQRVTQVSDALLQQISPFFRFPEWGNSETKRASFKDKNKKNNGADGDVAVRDLNTATASDLASINGIGQVLSTRIVKFRDRLGGFLVNEQLYDVYGLEPLVVERALKVFQVFDPPDVEKININTASVNELADLVYISYDLANNIVDYREGNGTYTSFDNLFNVEGFPVNKIDRIALYLSY